MTWQRSVLVVCLGWGSLSHASTKLVRQKKVPADKFVTLQPLEIKTSRFAEESFRKEWDKGCSDWDSFMPASENVAIRFERADDRYWLWGHARVSPERGETLEKLLKSTRENLSISSAFTSWVLPGLNEHPRKDSSYFVELETLKLTVKHSQDVYLTGPFHFKVPGLKLGGITTVQVKWEDNSLPTCEKYLRGEPDLRVWRFKMFPRADVLQWMMGEMTVLPDENGRDAIIKIRLALKPSLIVYRLLPTKLIENELRFRAQRVLANFVEFRRAKVWNSDATSKVDTPVETKVASPKKAPGSKSAPSAKTASGKSP